MTWVTEKPLSFFQQFCVNVLKCGPIPRHVAIIMDGNRRYAKKNEMEKVAGHTKGFDKLTDTLHWCHELGIREVTVYAFSIENFKRAKEEVDALLALAKDKYKLLKHEKEKLESKGVHIRVLGDFDYLSDDMRQVIGEGVMITKDNHKSFLNIAFSYTSRNEMTHAIRTVMEGVRNNEITVDDINEQLLADCLFTNHCQEPDMLIRTSGEIRFSDFLLWQIGRSQIHFVDIYWPEFNIWHLMVAVFQYQRMCKKNSMIKKEEVKYSDAVKKFLENVDRRRFEKLKEYAEMKC